MCDKNKTPQTIVHSIEWKQRAWYQRIYCLISWNDMGYGHFVCGCRCNVISLHKNVFIFHIVYIHVISIRCKNVTFLYTDYRHQAKSFTSLVWTWTFYFSPLHLPFQLKIHNFRRHPTNGPYILYQMCVLYMSVYMWSFWLLHILCTSAALLDSLPPSITGSDAIVLVTDVRDTFYRIWCV